MAETGAEILVDDGAEKPTPTPPPVSGTRPIDPARRLDGGGKALEYLGLSPAEFLVELEKLDPEQRRVRMQELRCVPEKKEFLAAVQQLVRKKNDEHRQRVIEALGTVDVLREAATADAADFVNAVNVARDGVRGLVANTKKRLGDVEPLKPAA